MHHRIDTNSSASPDSLSSATTNHSLELSSYCDAQFSSYTSTYDPTGKFTTSTRTWYQGYDNAGNQTGDIVTQSYATSTYTFTYEGYLAYQQGGAEPPWYVLKTELVKPMTEQMAHASGV